MKPTSSQFVAELKSLGLSQTERSRCIETFHDSGVDEARQQAKEIMARNAATLRGGERVLTAIFGSA